MSFTFAPKDLTDENLARAATEIEYAKTQARTDWDRSLIRDCEAMLASARRQATTAARLQSARDTVRHLGKDWNPQRGSQ